MRTMISFIGVLLIISGVALLVHQGFHYTYTEKEKVAQVGSVEMVKDTQKTVSFPPLWGGLAIAGGVVLMAIGRIGRKK